MKNWSPWKHKLVLPLGTWVGPDLHLYTKKDNSDIALVPRLYQSDTCRKNEPVMMQDMNVHRSILPGACAHMHIYAYIYSFIYSWTHIHTHMPVYLHICAYLCTFMYIYAQKHAHIYIYILTQAHKYIYKYMCMSKKTYIHIHICLFT